jgi:hypothetical protein
MPSGLGRVDGYADWTTVRVVQVGVCRVLPGQLLNNGGEVLAGGRGLLARALASLLVDGVLLEEGDGGGLGLGVGTWTRPRPRGRGGRRWRSTTTRLRRGGS